MTYENDKFIQTDMHCNNDVLVYADRVIFFGTGNRHSY